MFQDDYWLIFFPKKFFNILSYLDGILWFFLDSWLFFIIYASFHFWSVFFFLLCWLFRSFEVSFLEKCFVLIFYFQSFHSSAPQSPIGPGFSVKIAFSASESCNNFFWLLVYLPFLKEHLALFRKDMMSILYWNLIVITCA